MPLPINPATGQPADGDPGLELRRQLRRQLLGRPALRRLPALGDAIPAPTCPRGRRGSAGNGYWGTDYGDAPDFAHGGGTLRGFFDYQTLQVATIASVTDGTSNTIMVGEVLPYQAIDSNFWNENGGTAGTTIPINWNSNTVSATERSVPAVQGWSQRRRSAAASSRVQGVQERAPRGGQLPPRRRLGEVPQGEHHRRHLRRAGQPQRRRGHQRRRLLSGSGPGADGIATAGDCSPPPVVGCHARPVHPSERYRGVVGSAGLIMNDHLLPRDGYRHTIIEVGELS